MTPIAQSRTIKSFKLTLLYQLSHSPPKSQESLVSFACLYVVDCRLQNSPDPVYFLFVIDDIEVKRTICIGSKLRRFERLEILLGDDGKRVLCNESIDDGCMRDLSFLWYFQRLSHSFYRKILYIPNTIRMSYPFGKFFQICRLFFLFSYSVFKEFGFMNS